ncbi:hypothetical protein [Algihabitans albus]|uniref:hypothetical protein n=1 Tax=Algihabitans albus TaxID=2164067 RepID=UPI000E5C63C3|nr:hypothetical protein [Algihabitans albus]
MLLEARRAGQELLAQKAVTPHGQFKARIEQNTQVRYRVAANYMRVARLTKDWNVWGNRVGINEPQRWKFVDLIDLFFDRR